MAEKTRLSTTYLARYQLKALAYGRSFFVCENDFAVAHKSEAYPLCICKPTRLAPKGENSPFNIYALYIHSYP